MPFGGAIKLQGESEYIRALTQINSKLKETSADMKLVSASFASGDKSTQAVAQKAEVLNKKLEEQKQKLSLLKTEYSKMQGEVDQQKDNHEKLVQEYKKEEQELERLGQELGKDSKEYQDQQKKVDALAKEVDKSTKADIANEKALSKMRAEITKTEADIKKTTREIDNLGKETEETAKDTQEAGDGFTVMKGILSNLATQGIQKVIDGLKKMAKAAYEAWKEFDEGVDIIYAKTGLVGDAGDGLIDVYSRIAGKVPQDLDEVGTAVGEVATRFDLQGKELEDVTTQLLKYAKVNNTDVNGSIDSVQSMMAAWNIKTKDAGRVLNVLTAVSQKTGIQVDKLSDLMTTNAAALMEMGLSYEEAALFAGQFSKSGLDTNQALMGMKKALQAATKEGKPLNQYLADAERKIKGAKTETEALTIATGVFGTKAGPNMAKAIRNGNITFKEMQGALKGVNTALDDTYDAMLSLPDHLKMIANETKTIVGSLLDAIANDTLSDFVNNDLPAMLDQIGPHVNELIAGISAVFTTDYGPLKDGLSTALLSAIAEIDTEPIGEAIMSVIIGGIGGWDSSSADSGALSEAGSSIMSGILGGMKEYLISEKGQKKLKENSEDLWWSILGPATPMGMDGMKRKLGVIGAFAVNEVIEGATKEEKKRLNAFFEAFGVDMKKPLAEQGHEMGDAVITALWMGLLTKYYELERDAIGSMRGRFQNAINWVNDLLGGSLTPILETLSGVADGILDWISEKLVALVQKLTGMGEKSAQAFVDGILGRKDNARKGAQEIQKNVTKGFKEKYGDVKLAGEGTTKQLAKGITDKKSTATSAASNVASGTAAALKPAASTAYSIGQSVSDGIAAGISANSYKIYDLAQQIADDLTAKFNKIFEVNSPSKLMAREVGAPIAEGIAYGFENEMHDVTSQMADAIPKTFDISSGVNGSTIRARQEASMVKAFKAALSDVKIILNNKVAGQFVETTVSRLIYS